MNNMKLTHRLSFLYHHGKVPVDCVVRHKCRNRHCVNPEHLEVGTQSDNMKDRIRDGTMPVKLTADQVTQIRILAEIGIDRRYETLAELFGVSSSTIKDVVRRRGWKHIP